MIKYQSLKIKLNSLLFIVDFIDALRESGET